MTGKCYINFNVIFEMGVNGASGAGFLEALASSSYELASMSLKDNNVTLIRYGKIKKIPTHSEHFCYVHYSVVVMVQIFSGVTSRLYIWCPKDAHSGILVESD